MAASTPGKLLSREEPSRMTCATADVLENRSPASDIRIVKTLVESKPGSTRLSAIAVRISSADHVQELTALMDEVRAGRLTGLIARAADFYGPGNEKSFLIEAVYKNLKKGKRPNWFVDADKKHSFTYTPDAARATALLGNTPGAYNQVWHLPTDPNILKGHEMAALFSREMGLKAKKMMVLPLWMIRLLGVFMPFMNEMPEMIYQYDRDYFFDSSKFEKRFGIRATPYLEGVRATIRQ